MFGVCILEPSQQSRANPVSSSSFTTMSGALLPTLQIDQPRQRY